MLLTIIAFLFVFAVITLVHEGGHLYFSQKAGIRVHEFGLGFGPNIFSYKRNNTTYKINLLPILGYVKIAGLDTDDPEEKQTPENEKYYNKSVGKKLLSIVAGPVMNLIFGFLVFSLLFMIMGAPTGISNEIATISPGSVAEKIGLKPGDKIIALNKNTKYSPTEIVSFIHKNAKKELLLTIDRNGERLNFTAVPKFNEKMKVGLIGFSLKALYHKINPLQALYYGLKETAGLSLMVVLLLGKLMLGRLSLGDLAGPVGIAQITGQYAQSGLASLLGFTAFFSINVAILNLLPLPALDGGRIFFLLIEAVRRKALPIELENKVHVVGLYFFLALAAVLTINDVLRIFRN